MTSVKDFLQTIFLGQVDRAWVCSVKSETKSGIRHNAGWIGGRPDAVFLDPTDGHYYSLGLIKPGATRKSLSTWDGATMMTLDDVGEKSVDPADIASCLGTPTFIVQTSLKSQQWGYVFTQELKDPDIAARLQKAATIKFFKGGGDPGHEPVVQYLRLPSGVNDKDKHTEGGVAPFPVKLMMWNPSKRFDPVLDLAADMGDAWTQTAGLTVTTTALGAGAITLSEIAAAKLVDPVLAGLDALGMVHGPQGTQGHVHVTCPWEGDHTNIDDRTGYHVDTRFFDCKHSDKLPQGVRHTTKDVQDWLKVRLGDAAWNSIVTIIAGRAFGAPMPDPSVSSVSGAAAGNRGFSRITDITTDLPDAEQTITLLGSRKEVVYLAGAPEGGKSLFVVYHAVALAHDKPDMLPGGIDAARAGDVLIVTNEDTSSQYRKRMEACEVHHGLLASGRVRNVDVTPPTIIAVRDPNSGARNPPPVLTDAWKDLASKVEAAGKYAFIVVDTQGTTVSGLDENSSSDMGALVALLRNEAERLKVSIVLVQHTQKSQGSSEGSGKMTNVRGSGAAVGAARRVLTMVRLSDADIAKAPTPAIGRSYALLEGAKANHTARAGRTLWQVTTVARSVKDPEYYPGISLTEDIPVLSWLKVWPVWLTKVVDSADALTWVLARLAKADRAGAPLPIGRSHGQLNSAKDILGKERGWTPEETDALLKRAEKEGLLGRRQGIKGGRNFAPSTWETTLEGSKRAETIATSFDENPSAI